MKLRYEFVEFIPDTLESGCLYISIPYATASHRCLCGCGNEVVTPLTPTDWSLIFDGESVSLKPSIGNWSFDCKSHYWISKSKIIWAKKWSDEKIEMNRSYDRSWKKSLYSESEKGKSETKQKSQKSTLIDHLLSLLK